MKNPITIVFLGDIAAGKGTQAEVLAKKYKLKRIDTGVYSRKLVKRGVEGAKNRVERGKLTRSHLIKEYLRGELESLAQDKGLLLDGAKMPSEARMVYGILKKQSRKVLVLYITIPKVESLKRLGLRGRADDDQEAIQNRIDYYEKIYSKTIKFWKKQGLLKKVNGNQTIPKVTKDLEKEIKEYYGVD